MPPSALDNSIAPQLCAATGTPQAVMLLGEKVADLKDEIAPLLVNPDQNLREVRQCKCSKTF